MPQTYAHQYYGDLVYTQLPEEIRAVIAAHSELYDIGLQGPDILFYYHPLWTNPVATRGGELHESCGRTFFARSVMALTGMDPLVAGSPQETAAGHPDPSDSDDRDPHNVMTGHLYTSLSSEEARGNDAAAGLVYLYGCLCHFALDSICHPYINQYEAAVDGVTHSVIEGDLDRHLIALAGRDPVLEDQTARFIPSGRAARIIARFYPEIPERTLYAALRSFVQFHHLLRCPSDRKREFLYKGLRLIGQYDNLRGHITAAAPDPLCKEASEHLTEMLHEGVPAAAGLIAGFSQNLCYDPRFRLNYNGISVSE